jgi:hypothetical protein
LFPLSFPDAKGVQNKKAFDRDYTFEILNRNCFRNLLPKIWHAH